MVFFIGNVAWENLQRWEKGGTRHQRNEPLREFEVSVSRHMGENPAE